MSHVRPTRPRKPSDRPTGGSSVHELLPLDDGQVREIVDRWLGAGNTFLGTARLGQSADLLTRPLFLVQMLNLFESCGGMIPHQPWAASRQMARLLLEEWDRRHGLSRTSEYYRFGSEEKLEFLSSLAFELLTEGHVRFSHSQLSLAYSRICTRFGLAVRDCDAVLAEVEAHNGLVVQSGVNAFEFSHLSIQEVLAADHVLRLPSFEPRSMQRLPAVVAVATAMSSVPSSWFASVVLHQSSFQKVNSMDAYLSRVVAERPFWERSLELGAAPMRLMVTSSASIRAAVRSIVADPLAARSLLDALAGCRKSELW